MRLTDFNERDFENFGTEFVKAGGQGTSLMTSSANQDAAAGEGMRFRCLRGHYVSRVAGVPVLSGRLPRAYAQGQSTPTASLSDGPQS